MALNTIPNPGLTKRGFPTVRVAKPLIINGDMAVAQRATSKTGVTNGNFGIWTCDRINFTESGTMSAVLTITQESLTSGDAYTDGFSNAYKIDVTTADSSLAADDFYRTNYRIEGQDLQIFKKGTANAEKFTLAFWVKATKTGTNIVELNDNDNGRHCCASYTISSSDTWEKKVLNFAADTTGAWDNDNAESLRINFILGAGSNYTSGTLATSWASNTTANIAVGQVNNFDSTSNNVHITGVQLEVGEFNSTTLPAFTFESYGDNLLRCQRYYQEGNNVDGGSSIISGGSGLGFIAVNAGEAFGSNQWVVQMRATPTVTLYNNAGTSAGAHHMGTGDITGVAGGRITNTAWNTITKSSGFTDGDYYMCNYKATAEL